MNITFLKLGGSLITDKTTPMTARPDTIARIAEEIAAADAGPLIIGHGSGSFGHSIAKRHGTRQGVAGDAAWRGFAEVAYVANQLNHIVLEGLRQAALPVMRFQPSASALCENGTITDIASEPLRLALERGLMPLVYGDVAFDTVRGGTIISTEDVFTALAHRLQPTRILLAGDYAGVFDQNGDVIPQITPATYPDISAALGGSSATDVTGGMLTKVRTMLDLCQAIPGLSVRIFSGAEPGHITHILTDQYTSLGTEITA